jgi:bla regulator protein BlaR1
MKSILFLFLIFANPLFSQEESIPLILADKAPIYPGCDENLVDLKDCFSKNIQLHFMSNFDVNLLFNQGLPKIKQRIFIQFTITIEGTVKDIKIKSSNEKVIAECKKVIALLPNMIPAELDGKPVDVKYTLPFSFNGV